MTRLPRTPRIDGHTVAPDDRTNPVLITCALAWTGNPLLGMDATEHYARRVLESTFRHHSRDEILSWRGHFISSEQRNRWHVAKQWAVDLLGVAGAEHLPDEPCPTQHTSQSSEEPERRTSGKVAVQTTDKSAAP